MNETQHAGHGWARMGAMDHMARAGSLAGDKIKEAVAHAHQEGYFAPICTERHVSVRHYTWDAFKYVGDVMHIVALVLCVAIVLRESDSDGVPENQQGGVSFKTHLLFLIVFSSRFLNIFFCEQSIYLILYKVCLWSCTVKIVLLMWVMGTRYDKRDTLPLTVVLVPTFVVTLVFGVYSVEDHGLIVEFLWIFSMYLESVAMLPQYIYCYRDVENTSLLVSSYVFAMGGYRMVFGISWAFHYLVMPYYLDMSSLISGLLGIVFFCDYLFFRWAKRSTLSHICISVDDTIREAEEAALEMIDQDGWEEKITAETITNPSKGKRSGKPGKPPEIELSAEVEFHDAVRPAVVGRPRADSELQAVGMQLEAVGLMVTPGGSRRPEASLA